MANSPVYDGQDDTVLPQRLRDVLALLPERTARRLRDWITNYSVSEIQDQIDYILGDDESLSAKIVQPPINPDQPTPTPPQEADKEDRWDAADKAIKRVAEMYKTLTEAGMSEPTAVAIISDEVQGIRMGDQVQSGFAKIPVAGARALFKGDGIDDYIPSAGWPPTPIER